MNIKSLLLGSAAALVAVTGARAADAVVFAEPEPMDYVRVCDVYGSGYYYIPGTETCLSLSGLVRYQISFSDDDDGWRKNVLGRLDVNAKSETELGTLTGYFRFAGISDTATGEFTAADVGYMYMEYATITLGGLSMGLYDTLYDGDVGGEFDNGGGDYVHYISYSFAGANGFSATVALEEEDNNSDYMPNVVGKFGITQGWGDATLFVAYDDADDISPVGGQDDDFYVKGIVGFSATEMITIRAMGIWESGMGYYSTGYEWSVAAMIEAAISEKVSVGLGAQYWADGHDVVPDIGGEDAWSIGAEVGYTPVPGFLAKLQVQYDQTDTDVVGDDEDSVNGWLRFERSF